MWQNLLLRQNNYIYLFKTCHKFGDMAYRVTFPKNNIFRKSSLHKLFAILHPKQEIMVFFGQFYLKADGQRILEHPGLTL